MTLNRSTTAVAEKALLPHTTNREAWDPLPSPNGKDFAFLSKLNGAGTKTELWLAPLGHHGQPKKIATVGGGGASDGYALLVWND